MSTSRLLTTLVSTSYKFPSLLILNPPSHKNLSFRNICFKIAHKISIGLKGIPLFHGKNCQQFLNNAQEPSLVGKQGPGIAFFVPNSLQLSDCLDILKILSI